MSQVCAGRSSGDGEPGCEPMWEGCWVTQGSWAGLSRAAAPDSCEKGQLALRHRTLSFCGWHLCRAQPQRKMLSTSSQVLCSAALRAKEERTAVGQGALTCSRTCAQWEASVTLLHLKVTALETWHCGRLRHSCRLGLPARGQSCADPRRALPCAFRPALCGRPCFQPGQEGLSPWPPRGLRYIPHSLEVSGRACA